MFRGYCSQEAAALATLMDIVERRRHLLYRRAPLHPPPSPTRMKRPPRLQRPPRQQQEYPRHRRSHPL